MTLLAEFIHPAVLVPVRKSMIGFMGLQPENASIPNRLFRIKNLPSLGYLLKSIPKQNSISPMQLKV